VSPSATDPLFQYYHHLLPVAGLLHDEPFDSREDAVPIRIIRQAFP
jgi:hypothetical protein